MESSRLGPVIALLMQPFSHQMSYVPASYVKWLELAGARVVPLSYYATDAEVDDVFRQVNGALWPGGDGSIPRAARRMYARAVDAFDHGDIFPIWGTCDGFEWLMQIAAEDDNILTSDFDAWNLSIPLNLSSAARESRIFSEASQFPIMSINDR